MKYVKIWGLLNKLKISNDQLDFLNLVKNTDIFNTKKYLLMLKMKFKINIL